MNNIKIQSINCRLCDHKTNYIFNSVVLNKYDIKYYKCSNCSSLQTEKPFWLDETYSKSNLSDDDVGAAYRILRNHEKVFFLSKLLKIKKGLDWGSGDGLLCRLLRDYEINFYSIDKYSHQKYSSKFTIKDYSNIDLIVSFEVLEHLGDPNKELDFLFKIQPNFIFVSTLFYKDYGKDWYYLHPNTGMHVFFYSKKALRNIAAKYDYQVVFFDNQYALFHKKGCLNKIKLFLFRVFFSKYFTKIIRLYLTLIPAKGINKDK